MRSVLPIVLALALLLVWCPVALAQSSSPAQTSQSVGVDPKLGTRIPLDIPLRDANGKTVALKDLIRIDRPIVIVLAYSDCPMLCNLVLRGLANAARGTTGRPGTDYDLLTVSINPDEDPEIARRSQRALSAAAGFPNDPLRWRYLLGTKENIAALAGALGFRFIKDARTGEYAHPAVVSVLSPTGMISGYLYGIRHTPSDLDRAVDLARAEQVLAPVGSGESALTCYRIGTAQTRYGAALKTALRVMGVVLIGTLVGLAVVLSKRRQRSRAS